MEKYTAEICLYGNRGTGYGYMARVGAGAPFGKAPPEGRMPFDTCTGALWGADMDLRNRGVTGKARVYAPGGDRIAEVVLGRVPSYGWLVWAPVRDVPAAGVVEVAGVH